MYTYFVGLDVHKQTIAYCIKTAAGEIMREGSVPARRDALSEWVKTIPGPWRGGLEATLFSHWIYRHLKPHAARLEMGNPARLKAISAGKSKSDKLDARTLADLLRCDMFPACYVIAPELEGLRRQLRFRLLIVQQGAKFKNRIAGLLMETGVEFETAKLHGKRYFAKLIDGNPHIDGELRPMLKYARREIESLKQTDVQMIRVLSHHPRLQARVEALSKIDGVGPITALTWALEVGDPARFPSAKRAISYMGLCAAHRESAGKVQRGPISKQRNKFLQTALIEAAKIAPVWNDTLRAFHQLRKEKGDNANQATLAVARKLASYLLAADRAFFAPAVSNNAACVCLGMADLSK